MFVKLSMNKPDNKNIWVNTDQIVSLEPVGRSFGVNLSDCNTLVLDLVQYLVLVKAMKIKESLKLVKEIVPVKVDIPKISTTVFDKAIPKRAVDKQAEAKTLNAEEGKGTVVEKPKTKLVKKANKEKQIVKKQRYEHKRP